MVYGRRTYKKNYVPRKGNSKAKPTTRKAVYRKVVKSNFNKRVLTVLNRNSETKMKIISLADNHSIYGQGLTSTSQNQGSGHAGYLVPNLLDATLLGLDMGANRNQRIGIKVNNARAVISGVIKAKPYNTTSNPFVSPFEVHMVCYKAKEDITGNGQYLKLKTEQGQTNPDGTIENTLYPYNRDKYVIHKVRVFKLRGFRSEETLNGQGVIYETGGQSATLPSFVRFRCECPVAKKLMFNLNNSTSSNSWVSVAFYVVDRMNNTIQSTHTRCSVFMDAKLTFKDD